MNSTELAGVWNRSLTVPNQRGSSPSRASAKVTRGVDVSEPAILPPIEDKAATVMTRAPAGPARTAAQANSRASGPSPAGIHQPSARWTLQSNTAGPPKVAD